MRVYLGSDHAGFDLKARIITRLRDLGHDPVDCGPEAYDAEDDYPPFVLLAARRTVGDSGSLGVVIGGSGNGEAIAANKVVGVRCALAYSAETARLAREHNDANVVSLGARMFDEAANIGFVETFVSTPFSGETRHLRRIGQIADYERTGEVPPTS